jgi:tetratricopeptide (TPR) repeat protein
MICLTAGIALMRGAGPLLRGLSFYALALFFPVLILSGSRSGWVGTLLGLPVVLLLIAGKRSLRALVLTVIGFPLVAGAAIVALWVSYPEFQERLDSAIKIEGTAAWRLEAWKDTGEMIKDRPVLGHGPGSYRWLYSPYQSWQGDRWLRYAHNEYLHLWAEYGAVGLGLMAIFMLTLLASGLWLYSRAELQRDIGLLAGFLGALVATLGHGISDFNFHVYSLMHLLVLMGGLAVGGCFRSGLLKARAPPALLSVPVRAVASVLVLAGFVVALQVAMSGSLLRLVESDLERLDLRQREPYRIPLQRLERAASVDPGNWLIYLEQANIARGQAFWLRDPERRQAKLTEAIRLYEKALRLNPYDMNVHFGLGRSWMDAGDADRGIQYLQHAAQHVPNSVFYARELGMQFRRMGRYPEALAEFDRARRAGGWNDPTVQANHRWLTREVQRSPE